MQRALSTTSPRPRAVHTAVTAVALALLFAVWSFAAPIPPAFGVSVGRRIEIFSARGAVLTPFVAPIKFSEFALSPNGRRAVLVGAHYRGGSGGALYLFSLRTGRLRRLTHGQYWGKPEAHWVELYADPAFSPNGRDLVFAIRGFDTRGGDDNDAVMDGGPLAVMDLESGGVRILGSTLNPAGPDSGPGYSESPLWSPGGGRILYNLGAGGAIVSADGRSYKDLTPAMDAGLKHAPDEIESAEFDWIGPHCVAFGYFSEKTGALQPSYGLHILHLGTGGITALRKVVRVPPGGASGMNTLYVAGTLVLVTVRSGGRVYDAESGRLIYAAPDGSHLVPVPRPASIPCR